MKQQIREELTNPEFPNLKFLYSKEVLDVSQELLEELLDEERKDFKTKLKVQDTEIDFDTFEEFSYLDYFFSLLEHYQGVRNDKQIRTIIENFEPQYVDFGNEVAYSERYYEMMKIAKEDLLSQINLSPNPSPREGSSSVSDNEQKLRILSKSIEAYEVRGIALPVDKQSRLKEINKDLSELTQTFGNNVLDSQKEFEYILKDAGVIAEMPEDDRAVAKKRYEEKYTIRKAKSEEEYRKCFQFFQEMWGEEFSITLRDEQFGRFQESCVLFIGNEEKILGALQLITIDKKVLEYEPELFGIAKEGEKILGRVGVISQSRGKGFGSELIGEILKNAISSGEERIFLPSEIKNIDYYRSFGFIQISEPKDYKGNTGVLMSINLRDTKVDQEEKYLFDASIGSYMSIMKYCSDSDIRKFFNQTRNLFATEEERNNKLVILKILKLREERAKILGFGNHAELSLHFKMAESPEQVITLFDEIAQKARPKAESELSEVGDHFGITDLYSWDLSYYARKLREEKYALDERELKKYFEYSTVLDGMFDIVQRLYAIEMKLVQGESYSSEVQVYEVSRKGKFLSYFITDYFYDPLKRQGAWANILRENSPPTPLHERGAKKLVVNVCNFQKGADGVTLLTMNDVETLFHEFGHAIHEMLSISKYSELSGFHVEHDFVELPSQLLENWCRHKDGMNIFAKHYQSGEAIPNEMFQKLEDLDTFGNGQFVLKQNEYAMMDMTLHTKKVPETETELDAIIHTNFQKNSLFELPEVYNPHTSFTHIFDGGYAAGYYSYMWAEIIEKEVWKAFKDSGDIFSPEIAQKFHDTILSAGTTKKASELFRDFTGRDPQIDAFLSEKGLV